MALSNAIVMCRGQKKQEYEKAKVYEKAFVKATEEYKKQLKDIQCSFYTPLTEKVLYTECRGLESSVELCLFYTPRALRGGIIN